MGICGTTTVNYKTPPKDIVVKEDNADKNFSIRVQNVDYSSKEMDI